VTGGSTSRHPIVGPVGERVIRNVEDLRQARGLSFRDLAGRLAELGRPICSAVLHRLSQGRRRVDVDDLTVLAQALGVTPAQLLAQPGACAADDHPAVRASRALTDCLAGLVTAGSPEAAADARGCAARALRRAQFEIGELLEGQAL
jgi:transcriptional regulator with XRE-family HTH domain